MRLQKQYHCLSSGAFRYSNYSHQNEPQCGHPASINLDELKQLIKTDPTITTTNVASKLGYTQFTVYYKF
jgi:hypothetical protein